MVLSLLEFCSQLLKVIGLLNSWDGKSLSYAGQVCLVAYVVTSSFVHSFSVYKWCIRLLTSLNVVIHNFVWFGSISVRKSIIVKWINC